MLSKNYDRSQLHTSDLRGVLHSFFDIRFGGPGRVREIFVKGEARSVPGAESRSVDHQMINMISQTERREKQSVLAIQRQSRAERFKSLPVIVE